MILRTNLNSKAYEIKSLIFKFKWDNRQDLRLKYSSKAYEESLSGCAICTPIAQ